MDSLPPDALHQVLEKLGPADLLAASSSCRHLRAAAAPDSALWHGLCRRRWGGGLNAALWALPAQPSPQAQQHQQQQQQPGRPNYKALFVRDNGWAAPRFASQRYAGAAWFDEVAAANASTADDGTTTVAVSSTWGLRLLQAGPEPQAALRVQRAVGVARHSGGETWSAVTALSAGDGLVAAGGCFGTLTLWRLPEAGGQGPSALSVPPAAVLPSPEQLDTCNIVSQLHELPGGCRLAALHDALAVLRAGGPPSGLSMLDVPTWRRVGPPMRDVLDGFELAAAVPVGGGGGHELVAGSVRLSGDQTDGRPCQRCYSAVPPALCFHKPTAAAAALCVFDARTAAPLVARYATHHRSLAPHLEAVRDNFLLTSHAGTPLAVWDRRQMNGPVHEAASLPRNPEPGPEAEGWLALTPPDEFTALPASQGLHLTATHDWLVGRADNGMCWLWDLSERLGWADGSRAGSWLPRRRSWGGGAGSGAMDESEGPTGWLEAGGHHLDEHDFERSPLPLGILPLPYEVWSRTYVGEVPLHWSPPPAVWLARNRLVALEGLDVEEKKRVHAPPAKGSPYPSNAVAVASLRD